jgi:hypothetical protein
MAGCDVLTGAQVSRMSRWLPYEKIGSPCVSAYVRRTIMKKTAFVTEDGEAWRVSPKMEKLGVCRRRRSSACVADEEDGGCDSAWHCPMTMSQD